MSSPKETETTIAAAAVEEKPTTTSRAASIKSEIDKIELSDEESSSSESSISEASNTEGSMYESSSTSFCDCQSCENIRAEKMEVRRMNFDHASTMSEFYPGKVGGNHFDRCTMETCSNIYDNLDSVRMCHPDTYATYTPNGPSYLLRQCLPIWSLSTQSADYSPTSMTKILVDQRSNSPTGGAAQKSCCAQDSFVAAIGMMGSVIGSAGLLAYLILQVPEFRETIGPNYATVEGRSAESIYNPSTLIYSVELTAIILTTLIGILVNVLLVYGVRRRSCYFLLPWLSYHVLFIAGLFVAIILIVCFALPFLNRLFAIIPAVAVVLFIFLWSRVYQLYLHFRTDLHLSQESVQNQDESWYASAEQPTPSGSYN